MTQVMFQYTESNHLKNPSQPQWTLLASDAAAQVIFGSTLTALIDLVCLQLTEILPNIDLKNGTISRLILPSVTFEEQPKKSVKIAIVRFTEETLIITAEFNAVGSFDVTDGSRWFEFSC